MDDPQRPRAWLTFLDQWIELQKEWKRSERSVRDGIPTETDMYNAIRRRVLKNTTEAWKDVCQAWGRNLEKRNPDMLARLFSEDGYGAWEREQFITACLV
jgi:hypothetical protein